MGEGNWRLKQIADFFYLLVNEGDVSEKTPAGRRLQLSPPPIYKPPVQGAFSFLGCGNLPHPWLRIRPKAYLSHG